MKIGFWEIVVILVVALLIIGPDKLPEYMKSLGKGLKSLQKATSKMNDEVQENIVEPLNEAQKPLKEAMKPLQDTADQINKNLDVVNHPLKSKTTKENYWICPKCGAKATGNFCNNCGTSKPVVNTDSKPTTEKSTVENTEAERKEGTNK